MQPAPMDSEPTGSTTSQARPRAVFARHAASLIVIRDGIAGPEVLMGVRGAGHRFMPNRLVFPGGAVDPGDGTALAASEPRPVMMGMLGRAARPRLARGIAIAAARELEEETGLTLGSPPHLDALHYLCRAVTPPESSMRFNARFLVVKATHVLGTPRDTHELQDVGYRQIATVLEAGLMLVTREVLLRAQEWLVKSLEERELPSNLPVFKGRQWRRE